MKRVYADYASITPIDPKVFKEMKKYYSISYANPASIYTEGINAKDVVVKSRKEIAKAINCHEDEIIFTGSGTEANNLAILGVVDHLIESNLKPEDIHILCSAIEHSSVLEVFKALSKKGVVVETVSVDSEGVIDLEDLKKKIRKETKLVSVMMVNNEVGTIQPISEVKRVIKHAKKILGTEGESYPLLHTDASQGLLYLDINVISLGVDLLTIDSHKTYGPRGIGALFIKRGVDISPQVFGGGQERGLRSGTENVPAIAGFAKSILIAVKERNDETLRINDLKDYFTRELMALNKEIRLIGHKDLRVPSNVSIYFPNIDNEFFVLRLDVLGVACSTKSSCLKDSDESYVIKAMTHDPKISKGIIRFSFGRFTKKSDIKFILKRIKQLL
jgi:cysteine desulfurase